MSTYFATEQDIVPKLCQKVDAYYNCIRSLGLFERMRKSYRAYYGYSTFGWKGASDSSQIVFGGEQGELTMVKVNEYRSLISHLISLVTQSRPALQTRAVNTDVKSQAATILGNGLLDFYMRDKRLEVLLDQAVENAMIFGEGWVTIEWDFSLGEPYAADPSNPEKVINNGDLRFRVLNPFDVCREISIDSISSADWFITREFKNKYDIASKYPEFADDLSIIRAEDIKYLGNDTNMVRTDDSDLIPIFHFYHKKTESVPNGRYVMFVGNRIKLIDSSLPYDRLPMFRVTSGEIAGTAFGYSQAWDLLGLQEITDALHSTAMSNINATGVQNILIPKGAGIELQALTGGLNVVEYNAGVGVPTSLNLTATPPEVYNYMDRVRNLMETIIGVNSVVRGNPEASLKSGAALALVASQAIQASSRLQKAYTQLLEDVGTMSLKILRQYAKTRRIVSIAGKSNRPLMKYFTGTDLDSISGVVVDASNALSKSISGRLQIAEDLLNKGLIKCPEQFIQLLNTGMIEPMTEGETSELMLIRSENEEMMEGRGTPVVATDEHVLHIKEHKVVLSSIEARQNPQIIQVVLQHNAEHINQLRMADPDLLHILGQPSLAQPTALMANGAVQQGGGDAEAGGNPPPPGKGNSAPVLDGQNPTEAAGQKVNMPNLPKNPLTGKPYSPTDGGVQ